MMCNQFLYFNSLTSQKEILDILKEKPKIVKSSKKENKPVCTVIFKSNIAEELKKAFKIHFENMVLIDDNEQKAKNFMNSLNDIA